MATVRLEQVPVPQLVNTFPAFYGMPGAHFRIHNRPLILPNLNHINQVHVLSSHVFKTHFNIILPSTPRFSKWSLIQVSTPKSCILSYISPPPLTRRLAIPANSVRFGKPNSFGDGYNQFSPPLRYSEPTASALYEQSLATYGQDILGQATGHDCGHVISSHGCILRQMNAGNKRTL